MDDLKQLGARGLAADFPATLKLVHFRSADAYDVNRVAALGAHPFGNVDVFRAAQGRAGVGVVVALQHKVDAMLFDDRTPGGAELRIVAIIAR